MGTRLEMNHVGKFGRLTLLWLVACNTLGGQFLPPSSHRRSEGTSPSVATLKANVNLVLVETSVHDEHGRAVGNLQQEDFRVYEDGKEQEINSFSHEELPLAVALVVDNSSSIVAALR